MILGGSSKNAIPLPLGAASLLSATQHTGLKKSIFFLFLGNLACLVRIGFYNGLWRGRQCVGVVTRSRAYIYPNLLNPRNFSGSNANPGFTRDLGENPRFFPTNRGFVGKNPGFSYFAETFNSSWDGVADVWQYI